MLQFLLIFLLSTQNIFFLSAFHFTLIKIMIKKMNLKHSNKQIDFQYFHLNFIFESQLM